MVRRCSVHITGVQSNDQRWIEIYNTDLDLDLVLDPLPSSLGYPIDAVIRLFGVDGADTYSYRDGILYVIMSDRLRGRHTVLAIQITIDPGTGLGTAQVLWTRDLHDCYSCENVEASGPNRPGANNDALISAFPGLRGQRKPAHLVIGRLGNRWHLRDVQLAHPGQHADI